MAVELLRIAAERGLVVAAAVGAGGAAGWRVTCPRCTGWVELPARPSVPVWWVRRLCAFATRHRHLRRVLSGAVVRAAR